MSTTTATLPAPPPLPVDTVDEDSAKLHTSLASTPVFVGFAKRMEGSDIPENLAKVGYKALITSPLWGVQGDWQYVYKPLAAWEASQEFADEIIRLTGGQVFTFVSGMFNVLQAASNIEADPSDEIEDDDEQSEAAAQRKREAAAALGVERYEFFTRKGRQQFGALLAECPTLKLFAWARETIKRCDVRRVASAIEQSKPEDDPTKDVGGVIFSVKGAGEVARFYAGNRDQILRLALAAAWGSVGDFFVPR